MRPAVPVTILVATAAVVDWIDHDPEARRPWLAVCVQRHTTGDWGDLDPDDRQLNDTAVAQRDGRVLSRHLLQGELAGTGRDDAVWIITDDLGDTESPTTILWPSDY